MEVLGICSELLVQFFGSHGISAVYNENEGTVSLPDFPPYRFALQVYKSGEGLVEIEALCEYTRGQLMREWLSGFGDTLEQAVMDAQLNFSSCVFHVWVCGLLGRSNQHVKEFVWKINGEERKVCIGFPAGRGNLEAVEQSGWQEAWYEAIRSLPLSQGLHWLSLCYAHGAGEMIACDALLDNENCDLVRQRVLSFDWPKDEKVYSVRQFMIVRA